MREGEEGRYSSKIRLTPPNCRFSMGFAIERLAVARTVMIVSNCILQFVALALYECCWRKSRPPRQIVEEEVVGDNLMYFEQ